MTVFRRLFRAALLSATLGFLVLTGATAAYAKVAPPERPVGAPLNGPGVSSPLSGLSAQVTAATALWQLVLVASLSAIATVFLTLIGIRVAAKHRPLGAHVGP